MGVRLVHPGKIARPFPGRDADGDHGLLRRGGSTIASAPSESKAKIDERQITYCSSSARAKLSAVDGAIGLNASGQAEGALRRVVGNDTLDRPAQRRTGALVRDGTFFGHHRTRRALLPKRRAHQFPVS